jgi:hypothetical protein
MAHELIEVHVGFKSAERSDARGEERNRVSLAEEPGDRPEPSTLLSAPDFPWEALDVAPRFVGSESTGCVAALQPNILHGRGDEEFKRFLDGAEARGETALLISMIGQGDTEARNPLAPHDASVLLPGARGSIGGRRLPVGVIPKLADGLSPAEKDLGLRLRNRPAGASPLVGDQAFLR